MTATLSDDTTQLGRSGISFGGVLASEWLKLRTLRSTWWVVAAAIPLTLLLATVMALNVGAEDIAAAHGDAGLLLGVTPAGVSVLFQQLIIVVLGTLAITSEFATGMVRTSFAAVPSRLPLVVGKALVVGAAGFGLGVINALIAWAAALPILVGRGASITFGDLSPLLWSVLGTGAVIALTAVFGLGLGCLIRVSAGAISLGVGALFVLTLVGQLIAFALKSDVVRKAQAYLLSNAANGTVGLPNGDLTQWQSLIVMICWAAVAFVVGAIAVRVRDV
ncbi:hypothetical protein [Leifsonia sp. 2MCAF36]|uniref:hypothetical protein n=1 Tax=Leifsonia sp. 2MCAF36 TaxID=3232988 RepID=UPI003F979BDB